MKTSKMKNKKVCLRTRRGSAVAYLLAIIFAVSIIMLSIVQFISNQAKNAYYSQNRVEAFQIAEAGVGFYRWYLAHETDGKTASEIDAFWLSTSPAPLGVGATPYKKEYFDNQDKSLGFYEISVTPPEKGSSIASVAVVGWTNKYKNAKKTIKVRFRRPAWSDFAILTNDPSDFDANWNIKGKVMSNSGVHFDGVANNIVSSALSTYYHAKTGQNKDGVWTSWENAFNTTQNSQVFLAGTEFPIAPKDFTGVAIDLSMMKESAQRPSGTTINDCSENGCYFENELYGRHIVLKPDDTFDISVVSSIKNNSNSIKNEKPSSLETYTIPEDGIIFVGGDVWVEGKIDGKRVTIVAANFPTTGIDANIYVGGANLEYTNFNGTDIVGLIAQGNIEFTTDGPADLKLHAAFLTQNGGMIKKDYNPNCCGQGCEEQKNSLGIFGSVASNKALAFTTTKACNNEKAVGFQGKQVVYDNNLLYFPPPYFPTDAQYTMDDWNEL